MNKAIILFFILLLVIPTNTFGLETDKNLQVEVSVFYKRTAQSNANVVIDVFDDFLKQLKISSITTYTYSGGTAIAKIEAIEGQWVVIHVFQNINGEIKEAEEQDNVRVGQTRMSFTINLYQGFLPFKNSINKEFVNGIMLMISLLIIVIALSYISKRAYKRGGLYQEVVVEGRLGERKTRQYVYGKNKKKKRQFGSSRSNKSKKSVHKAMK